MTLVGIAGWCSVTSPWRSLFGCGGKRHPCVCVSELELSTKKSLCTYLICTSLGFARLRHVSSDQVPVNLQLGNCLSFPRDIYGFVGSFSFQVGTVTWKKLEKRNEPHN